MTTSGADFESLRLMARVLTLHYEEGRLQSQIATELGLSSAKVNRLIKQGRELGMVEITVNSPFQRLFDLERKLTQKWNLKTCLVVPTVTGNAETTLNQVGKAAGRVLAETIRDGDTIGISGGKALRAVIENMPGGKAIDVNVVPLTGGVQGHHFTDVNHVATTLANLLGGRATLIHAPLFSESPEERELLMSVKSVQSVMQLARNADVMLAGIGSVLGPNATYRQVHPMSDAALTKLVEEGVRGELLGHLIEGDGKLSECELNSMLVGVPPTDAAKIPIRIGVASGPEKADPIRAALNGQYINALVVDEEAAEAVLTAELETV
ncbi:MAG: sugar-binding transcriptional regulator [Alphaproteobacteria bacterium]